MRRITLRAALAAGLLLGAVTATQAKLPPAPAKSDAEKAADAQKAAAAKSKAAEADARAQDRAVANYRKSKGIAEPKTAPASKSGKK